jgi:hypothetical protein
MTEIDPKFCDDAEMLALQVVRECARENYSRETSSSEMYTTVHLDLLLPFIERHGGHGVLGLIIAMGRLTASTWSVVLDRRLGHFPTKTRCLRNWTASR